MNSAAYTLMHFMKKYRPKKLSTRNPSFNTENLQKHLFFKIKKLKDFYKVYKGLTRATQWRDTLGSVLVRREKTSLKCLLHIRHFISTH
jgi:hypothetical protein